MDQTAPTLSTRERIVATASEMTTELGWATVTMGSLAARVGYSRQTIYNEIGNKNALAEAMILLELDRFLALVHRAFDDHPGDVVEALRQASRDIMVLAKDNTLLHAVVSATHGADTELLPLLTTHAESLMNVAHATVMERIKPYGVHLEGIELGRSVDLVVRLVLSHVMQPSGDPQQTADDIAWVIGRVLRD